MIERSIAAALKEDLGNKIVILSGPRQAGKTTLARNLLKDHQYLSFDLSEDRTLMFKKEWDRRKDLIVFDELHKMRNWKSWIKGVFDKEGLPPRILITGSARLNQFRKTGDSLAGRHFSYRLHPFDLKELKLKSPLEIEQAFEGLLEFGGFPEPFLKGEKRFYNRWQAGHLDLILRQDLIDLEGMRDIRGIELLVQLLSERVGNPVAAASLARDLQRDPKTAASWIEILEDLHVVFRLTPWSKSLVRAVRKEPKYYFFDTGAIRADLPAKFENLVACALYKEVQRLNDVEGVRATLHYLKAKGGREIDFLVAIDDKPKWLIEAKWGDVDLSPSFRTFDSHFPRVQKIQLVARMPDRVAERTTEHGHQILRAAPWLTRMDLL